MISELCLGLLGELMDRSVQFDKELVCDNCGKKGAFDFMGDCYCADCLVECKSCNVVFVKNRDHPSEYCCECGKGKK